MLRRLSLILGMALLVLGFALPASAQSGGTARVRVIHASPDAPAVDVFANGDAVLEGVSFPAISDYLEVPAGEYDFAVSPAGDGADAAVISTTQTLAADGAYTIAAVGLVGDGTITGQVFEDDLTAPADGQAHVRVLHLSPDAPAVAVGVAGGDTLIDSLEFPNASDYLPVPAGTYDLQVTPASDPSTVALDLAGTTLEAGTIYDVAAVGQLANIAAEVGTYTPSDDDDAAASPSASASASAAPSASPAAGGTPSTLPNTGAGTSLSVLLIALGVLLVAGGLFLRRRTA